MVLQKRGKSARSTNMSLAEIKREINSMTPDEREELAVYLKYIELQNDLLFREQLTESMRRMDRGEKISAEEVLRVHQEKLAKGE
jgi:hypothetical protein